jgi:hypothetical protein
MNFSLTKVQQNKWLHNMFIFLAPLGVIYFGATAYILQLPNHTFDVKDLVPSSFTIGAMVLYVVNSLFDLSRKLTGK